MEQKTFEQLRSRNMELSAVLSDMEKAGNVDCSEYREASAEYNKNNREMEGMNLQAQNAKFAREQKPEVSLTKMLREHMHNKVNQFNYRDALTAAGLAGKAIDEELQAILEPLHANTALDKLGVKWYEGMPMGDISIPVMGKGSVTWAGETGASADGTPAFGDNIVLKPYRLTGHFDFSEQMLLQDTVGVEAALRREAINALVDTFEATVLGNESGTVSGKKIKPDGLFYGATIADATTFAKACELESTVEDNCISGDLKYLLSTKAKADFRNMAKSTKSTQLVMEGGTIDGTPTVVTQNVKNGTKGLYAYGNFQNLAVGVWNDLIFKMDDSIVYADGKIRIYVSGYFDAAKLREGAFVYGDTRYVAG